MLYVLLLFATCKIKVMKVLLRYRIRILTSLNIFVLLML